MPLTAFSALFTSASRYVTKADLPLGTIEHTFSHILPPLLTQPIPVRQSRVPTLDESPCPPKRIGLTARSRASSTMWPPTRAPLWRRKRLASAPRSVALFLGRPCSQAQLSSSPSP